LSSFFNACSDDLSSAFSSSSSRNAFNKFCHNIDPSVLADFKSFISSSTELVIAGLDKKLGIILINDTMDRDAAGAHLNVPANYRKT
jgi:hypothetical protein